ncbi:hypothetical protein QLX52_30475 [Streptomyces albus]|uniref:hypothetical protein n=1 Tax=Streptomyces albus TaxID=1888 RepID=UPI0024AD5ED7|nr:hypothetical protein [Streptomyces albus]MDI6413136.1 hypothetical protein [Streptomyces albus]
MPNKGSQDITNSMAMLHTTVLHTAEQTRESFTKGLEKLEKNAEEAQRETSDAVTAELSRMRTDFRDAKNQMANSRNELLTEIRSAASLLRETGEQLTSAVEELTSEREKRTEYAAAFHANGSGEAATAVSTLNGDEPAAPAPATIGALPLPEPRHSSENASAASDDTQTPEEAVPEAGSLVSQVAELLREELAPLRCGIETLSTTVNDLRQTVERQQAREAGQHTETEGLRAELVKMRETVERRQATEADQHTQLEALRAGLAKMRETVERRQATEADQHTQLEALRAELAKTRETLVAKVAQPSASAPQEHRSLLERASRVSSVVLVCHRDLWEYLAGQAGRHPHFRMPTRITEVGDDRVSAPLSGRSLIAVLSVLQSTRGSSDSHEEDLALANTVYTRIEERLADLGSDGDQVTITLDDRSPLAGAPGLDVHDDAPAAPAEGGASGGPEEEQPDSGESA